MVLVLAVLAALGSSVGLVLTTFGLITVPRIGVAALWVVSIVTNIRTAVEQIDAYLREES